MIWSDLLGVDSITAALPPVTSIAYLDDQKGRLPSTSADLFKGCFFGVESSPAIGSNPSIFHGKRDFLKGLHLLADQPAARALTVGMVRMAVGSKNSYSIPALGFFIECNGPVHAGKPPDEWNACCCQVREVFGADEKSHLAKALRIGDARCKAAHNKIPVVKRRTRSNPVNPKAKGTRTERNKKVEVKKAEASTASHGLFA